LLQVGTQIIAENVCLHVTRPLVLVWAALKKYSCVTKTQKHAASEDQSRSVAPQLVTCISTPQYQLKWTCSLTKRKNSLGQLSTQGNMS